MNEKDHIEDLDCSDSFRDIQHLDCSDDFNRLNFERVTYTDVKGEALPSHEVFGKCHDNVLRVIEALDCSESFRALNFEEMEIEIQAGPVKRMSKVYLMTTSLKVASEALPSHEVFGIGRSKKIRYLQLA